MPETRRGGELVLYVKGSFDIFRYLVRLPLPPLPTDSDGDASSRAHVGEYLHVREYRPGDESARVDALRSSMRDMPYVRVADHAEAVESRASSREAGVPLVMESSAALSPRDARDSWLVHAGLVALAFVVIALQWESWLLSGMLLATIALVWLYERLLGRDRG